MARARSDTIFALASGEGRAGVSVIRVSGPMAYEAGRALSGALPKPRVAALRAFRDAEAQVIDEGLLLVFEAGQSFTGEDIVEFQCHGSRAVVQALLGALDEIDGLRLAAPGEFSRRAFENGRLDLTQVEALGDLIEAETEAQRKLAVSNYSGALRDYVG
ncbi:MAG: tRNA uridine-5-carboxymethylaminomethyl(34) synthesis GTPase MnmE, partial [Pseudomonadota bacterium]